MAFPSLAATAGSQLHTENRGTPANGNETFKHGLLIHPDDKFFTDFSEVEVELLGEDAEDATFVSMDRENLTLNFVTDGASQVLVRTKHTPVDRR